MPNLTSLPFIKIAVLGTWGRAVHNLSMVSSITQNVVPFPDFRTHFVRSLWVTRAAYTPFVRGYFPQNISLFQSVKDELCSLSTDLTIMSTFSNQPYLIYRKAIK